MKSNRLALHPPFLIAAYPVIALCAKNADRLTLSEMLRPLGAALLCAALFMGLAQLAFRNRAKSGVYGSLLVIIFYSFVGLRSVVQKMIPALTTTNVYQRPASVATLALCICIGAAAFFVMKRTKRDLNTLTQYLSILVAILLVFPLISLAQSMSAKSSLSKGMSRWDTEIARTCKSSPGICAAKPAPDIYYIILDMYARPDVQKSSFGYDDTAFTHYLAGKGFYLAKDSHSNYPFTQWSLVSSLNSDYLTELDKYAEIDSVENLNYMIRDNRIARQLKSLGYQFVLMSSGWEVSANSDVADLVLPKDTIKITEMERVLIKKSILDIWWRDSVPYLRPYVTNCFEDLAELPKIKGPKFTFAHFVCPHEPWLFDREGDEPTDPATPERPTAWRKNYTDQVGFVNAMTERLVDRILATSKTPPIIIIQGDHGAYEPEFYTRWWTSEAKSLSNDEIAEGHRPRVSILNAYYFPGNARKALYPSISPVNTFRVLLNEYFGYHLKLLGDVSYIPKRGQCRNEMSPKDLRMHKF